MVTSTVGTATVLAERPLEVQCEVVARLWHFTHRVPPLSPQPGVRGYRCSSCCNRGCRLVTLSRRLLIIDCTILYIEVGVSKRNIRAGVASRVFSRFRRRGRLDGPMLSRVGLVVQPPRKEITGMHHDFHSSGYHWLRRAGGTANLTSPWNRGGIGKHASWAANLQTRG